MSSSSNVLTEWRKAVMAQLDTNLQDGGFTVLAGFREGPSKDRDLAVVFVPPMESDGNVNFARPVLVVRAWKASSKMPKTDPRDPEPVEQLMVDLAECLAPIQVLPDIGGGKGLFWNLQSVEPDYDDWGVQATLVGWTENPGSQVPHLT
jgi:hypothetical protein